MSATVSVCSRLYAWFIFIFLSFPFILDRWLLVTIQYLVHYDDIHNQITNAYVILLGLNNEKKCVYMICTTDDNYM